MRLTFSSDGDELDSLGRDEVECFVDVGDLVETHLAAIWLRQLLARDHLQQQHQFEAVAEVMFDVLDLRPRFTKMTVAPGGESLFTETGKEEDDEMLVINQLQENCIENGQTYLMHIWEDNKI